MIKAACRFSQHHYVIVHAPTGEIMPSVKTNPTSPVCVTEIASMTSRSLSLSYDNTALLASCPGASSKQRGVSRLLLFLSMFFIASGSGVANSRTVADLVGRPVTIPDKISNVVTFGSVSVMCSILVYRTFSDRS